MLGSHIDTLLNNFLATRPTTNQVLFAIKFSITYPPNESQQFDLGFQQQRIESFVLLFFNTHSLKLNYPGNHFPIWAASSHGQLVLSKPPSHISITHGDNEDSIFCTCYGLVIRFSICIGKARDIDHHALLGCYAFPYLILAYDSFLL